LDQYGVEIRGFCVNFLWVVEAADVPAYSSWLMVVVSTNLKLARTAYGEIEPGVDYDIWRLYEN
jgi:hypothetical protein